MGLLMFVAAGSARTSQRDIRCYQSSSQAKFTDKNESKKCFHFTKEWLVADTLFFGKGVILCFCCEFLNKTKGEHRKGASTGTYVLEEHGPLASAGSHGGVLPWMCYRGADPQHMGFCPHPNLNCTFGKVPRCSQEVSQRGSASNLGKAAYPNGGGWSWSGLIATRGCDLTEVCSHDKLMTCAHPKP